MGYAALVDNGVCCDGEASQYGVSGAGIAKQTQRMGDQKPEIAPPRNCIYARDYYDYTDKQVSSYFADDIYPALARLQNAPEGEAYGLDAEVTALLTDELTAIAGVTLLHTEYGDFPTTDAAGQPTNNQGDPFLYSPEQSFSLSLLYDDQVTDTMGLRGALSARWQSESYAGAPDEEDFHIDSYGVVNGSISLYGLDSGWEFGIWGKNLLDEYYWPQVSSNANVVLRFAGRPRTYGASISYRY